jgi:hypothetical protein
MEAIPLEIQKLFDKYPSLNTFAEVAIWDELAAKEIENLSSTIKTNDITMQFKRQALIQAEQERQQKPAILRIFSGSGEEKN